MRISENIQLVLIHFNYFWIIHMTWVASLPISPWLTLHKINRTKQALTLHLKLKVYVSPFPSAASLESEPFAHFDTTIILQTFTLSFKKMKQQNNERTTFIGDENKHFQPWTEPTLLGKYQTKRQTDGYVQKLVPSVKWFYPGQWATPWTFQITDYCLQQSTKVNIAWKVMDPNSFFFLLFHTLPQKKIPVKKFSPHVS